jgi:two-component system, repressor protein LuxO
MVSILREDGYRVLAAAHAAEARRLARRHHPRVIVLDLLLPDQPGLDLMAQLRAYEPTRETPVVVVSGSAWLMLDHEVRRAFSVLQKPFDTREFVAIVHQAAAVRPTAQQVPIVRPARAVLAHRRAT